MALPSVQITIPTASTEVALEVKPGEPLFVLGRNGTGKSALVQRLVREIRPRAIYLPGSRPIAFENESISLTPASRAQLTSNLSAWDTNPVIRWKNVLGAQRNEKAIHDLTAAETQFKVDAANEIALEGSTSKAIARLQSDCGPIARANALLAQSNLPVKCVLDRSELKASRDGQIFSLAKMSDGERSAFILIAEVVAAPDGSIIIIDEPERHLHRAITVPLILALLRERPDNTYIVSTHELELPAESPQSKMLIVRGCQWRNEEPCSWDVDVITSTSGIPEDLRVDVLGSRRKILFVEGINSSLDQPLYALLFPNASVRSRESCREVERSVTGLRATEDAHHVQAFGLVDNDGMGPAQVSAYEAKGVYPLQVHAVESLYYSPELIEAVATRQAETLGVDPKALIADATQKGLVTLNDERLTHLASRVAERHMRDTILAKVPDRSALIGGATDIAISVASPYPAERTRLQALHDGGDLNAIIARYPIRESGALDAVARALKFPARSDYEKAALARVQGDAVLRGTLRARFGALARCLS